MNCTDAMQELIRMEGWWSGLRLWGQSFTVRRTLIVLEANLDTTLPRGKYGVVPLSCRGERERGQGSHHDVNTQSIPPYRSSTFNLFMIQAAGSPPAHSRRPYQAQAIQAPVHMYQRGRIGREHASNNTGRRQYWLERCFQKRPGCHPPIREFVKRSYDNTEESRTHGRSVVV